jgi:hypothetical protein
MVRIRDQSVRNGEEVLIGRRDLVEVAVRAEER